jgi:hypothetical protein
LVVTKCQGGTTIINGWPPSILLTCSPLTSGPIGRSTDKWSTCMLPIGI